MQCSFDIFGLPTHLQAEGNDTVILSPGKVDGHVARGYRAGDLRAPALLQVLGKLEGFNDRRTW